RRARSSSWVFLVVFGGHGPRCESPANLLDVILQGPRCTGSRLPCAARELTYSGPQRASAATPLPVASGAKPVVSCTLFASRAGVVQWQYRSFPSFGRGFDSHRPLQLTRKFKLNRLPLHT